MARKRSERGAARRPRGPLQVWRDAERAIGRGERALGEIGPMPPYQLLLLRALDALERGERAGVERVAREAAEAGQPEVAQILDLLLRPAAGIDPTALRAAAKAAGLGDGYELPFLDLLRLLAAWRANPFAGSPAAKLKKATTQKADRPALAAAVDALKGPAFRNEHWSLELGERLPRALQLWQALRYHQNQDGDDPRWWLMSDPPSPRDFPPERWPELFGGGWQRILGAWADEPERGLEASEIQGALEELLAEPAEVRGGWARRLLGRIHGEIQAGHPLRAQRLVAAAAALVEGLDLDGEVTAILRDLSLRLGRLAAPEPRLASTGLLQQLWSSGKLSGEDRLAVAHALMKSRDQERGALPGAIQGEALLALLLGVQDPDARIALLREHGARFEPAELAASLPADIPASQRLHMLGMVHALRGDHAEALQCAVKLAGDARGGPASLELLSTSVEHSRRLDSRVVRRALEELAHRLAAHPPAAFALIDLLFLVQKRWGKPIRKRWVHAFRPALLAASRAAGEGDRERAAEVVAGLAAGEDDAADRVLRPWVRGLTRHPDPDVANARVITSLAWMLGLATPLGIVNHLGNWPERLVTFLRRRAKARVAEQVDPLADDHPGYRQGLAILHDTHRERLGDSPVWLLCRGLALTQRGEEEEGDELLWRAVGRLGHAHPLVQRARQRGLFQPSPLEF